MANDLMQGTIALPAHIRAAFGDRVPANTDLASGVGPSYPIMSYKGKVWHVVENGERSLVTQGGEGPNADQPAPTLAAVIVRANPNLNKTYYPDGYEEGSTEKPLCHSDNAIAPALDAQEPQAKKCAVCPHNQWGSKITENGARGKACSDARRLAIAPPDDLERVMLLRVPAASLKTLATYATNLEKRGVPYQALVTRIGFDHTVAYPSLTFKPEGWLDQEQVNQVLDLYESDLVRSITAVDAVPPAEAEPEDDGFALPPGGPAAAPAARAAPAAAQPARGRAATRQVSEAEVEQALGGATPPPAATAVAARKSTGFGGAATRTTAAPAAAEPQPEPEATQSSGAQVLVAGAMSELDAVLGQFDDAEG